MQNLAIEGETGNWKVTVGDREGDHLGNDEALWCVAYFLMHQGEAFLYLLTPQQRKAWEEKYGTKAEVRS